MLFHWNPSLVWCLVSYSFPHFSLWKITTLCACCSETIIWMPAVSRTLTVVKHLPCDIQTHTSFSLSVLSSPFEYWWSDDVDFFLFCEDACWSSLSWRYEVDSRSSKLLALGKRDWTRSMISKISEDCSSHALRLKWKKIQYSIYY